jgi:hypothetical protein
MKFEQEDLKAVVFFFGRSSLYVGKGISEKGLSYISGEKRDQRWGEGEFRETLVSQFNMSKHHALGCHFLSTTMLMPVNPATQEAEIRRIEV